MFAFPALGYWLDPSDPFFLNAEFPWLILTPVLPALRYGFSHGFVSALALIGMMATAWQGGVLSVEDFPDQLSIGMLILGMLVGEFSDMYDRRLSQQRVINDYQRMRLDEFTRNYHLLKVSHDRLEHRIAASTNSLRGALLDLRKSLAGVEADEQMLAHVASRVMSLFAGFGWIQVSGMYEVRHQRIVVKPLATLGDMKPVDPFDPMVRKAIVEGRLVSLREELMTSEEALEEDLLAVVPLVDVNGRVWGLVIIREMPFVALHQDNLRLLAVLGGYIGDLLSTAHAPEGDEESAEANAFVRDLRRALRDHRDFGLPAVVITLRFPEDHPELHALLDLFLSQTRGLDRAWRPKDSPNVLFLLMPLTTEMELEPYKARMEAQLRQRFDGDFETLGIRMHQRPLRKRDNIHDILESLHEMAGFSQSSDPGVRGTRT